MNEQHLLIVDDEPSIRELLQSYFEKQGFRITTSSTAADALEIVEKDAFDLIILDVILADADGLEVLGDIRKLRPQTPVIVMTGIGMDESLLKQAKSKGAAGYVSKTMPLDQLLAEVRGVLSQT